ncbi:fibronectin type III domain-containing protein, partial [Cryobacterium sp. 1639]|uniref:fibronectin type III domain-containing protein n=1 Tax=Cryobacterium inferilacus TaxID=2866629 RepID=UPI001C72D414
MRAHEFGALLSRAAATLTVAALIAVSLVAAPGMAQAASLPDVQAIEPTQPPDAPVIVDVVGDGLAVMVSWLPPAESAEVGSYELVAVPASEGTTEACPEPSTVTATADSQSTGAFITGLCAQVAYTVTMSALNVVGASETSNESDLAVPVEVLAPRVPVFTGALGREGQVVATWAEPSFDGGSPVTGYNLTASAPDGTIITTAEAGPTERTATLGGLSNGVEYAVALVALNPAGSSAAASTTATPSAAYSPGAPQGLTVVPDGEGALNVSWNVPADDGGAEVTGYSIDWQRAEQAEDGSWVLVSGAEKHALSAGGDELGVRATSFEEESASYLFTVTATNAAGVGAPAASTSGASPTVEVKDRVIVLDEGTVQAITGISAEGIAWAEPAPDQVTALRAGDVLVAAATDLLPGGLLRKVEAIAISGGEMILTTSDASLTDVFETVSLSAELDATAADGGAAGGETLPDAAARMAPLSDGVQTMRMAEPGLSAGVSATLRSAFGLERNIGAVHFKGQVSVEGKVSLDLAVSGGNATVEAAASASFNLEGEAGVSGDKEWEIGEIKGVSSTFFIGLVPVVVQPRLPLFLTMGGEVTIGVSASATVGGSIAWDSSRPDELRGKDLSHPLQLKATPLGAVSVTGNGYVGLKASPMAALYSLTGPSLVIEARLQADIDFAPDAGKPFLTVSRELIVKAGLVFKAFGQHVELATTLSKTKSVAYTIASPPTAKYAITPSQSEVGVGSSIQFSAKRSDGVLETKTWAIKGGIAGDRVTSSGLFTPAEPAGRSVTIVAGDGTGASGSTTVRVGTLFTAPRNLSVRAQSSALGLDISWAAPTATGDAALYQYIVRTTPSTGTHTLDADQTSLSITELGKDRPLTAGTYTVSVYATNRVGKISPATSKKLELYPLCTISFTSDTSNSWDVPANWDKNRVPAKGDWACLNGHDVTVASGTTASVAGLTAGAAVTINGVLNVSTYFSSTHSLLGSGTFEAGTTVEWELSGNVSVNVVNRGDLTLIGQVYLAEATLTNHGTLTLTGHAYIYPYDSPDENALINESSGRLIMTAAEGNTPHIGVPVTNRGTIETTSASFGDTLTNNGTFTIHPDTDADSPTYVRTLELGTGSLSGTGTLYISNTVVPTSGKTLSARSGASYRLSRITGGTLTLPAGSTTSMSSANQNYDVAADVVNRGDLTLIGQVYLAEATLTNHGT